MTHLPVLILEASLYRRKRRVQVHFGVPFSQLRLALPLLPSHLNALAIIATLMHRFRNKNVLTETYLTLTCATFYFNLGVKKIFI
jgi:hypothetical protein